MLHPDLQKLLNYALKDGVLSEKETEILRKKAVELGEDIDVLEMVIEGELQKISKSKEGEKQINYACPNCGSSIPSSSIKCGFCGFEISKSKSTGEDHIMKLQAALSKLDVDWSQKKHTFNGMTGSSTGDPHGKVLNQNKATIISTFTMPNDKENLLEFFLFCDNNADTYSKVNAHDYNVRQVNRALHPAWAGKARMGYNKLKRFENDDDEIREIILKYKKKYHQEADEMKAISINRDQGNGKAVLMGLNQTGVILFFVLLVFCFPTCWLPFIIPSCKAG